jgi:iron complex outermembrane receptor protein
MLSRIWLPVSLFLVLHTGFLLAQDCHVALQGHVYDADTREPLAYATVFVPEVGRGAVTDEKGHYVIPNLCEQTAYTVEVRHVECEHQTQIVRLQEHTTLDILLPHSAVLEEVLVLEKALQLKAAQADAVVSRIDLAAGQGINLGEALKKLPGVATLQTGATISKPVIQGLHSNRVAIVSNNIVLEGQQWGAEHGPEVDPFTADKVTVVKGAAGVRYGVGAIAGAVVMEPAPLRETPGLGGWVTTGLYANGLGGVASGAVDWRLPGRSLTFRLQGTAKRSGNLRAPDYWLGNTGAAELNGSFMAGWKTERRQHQLAFSSFNQRLGILRAAHVGNLSDLAVAIASDTPRNNVNRFDYAIDRPYQQVRHQTARYNAVYRINEKWKFNTQYAFQYNHRQEYDIVRSATNDRPQISFQLWTNTLNLSMEHFAIRHWQGGIGVQALHQLNYVGRGGFIPDYATLGGSIWAMERWRRLPDPWEFELGVRYDYRRSDVVTRGNLYDVDTLVHFGNLSGSAGAIYHFNKAWSLTLHTGYAWRPPQVNELFARGVHFAAGTYEEGRAGLQSEKAWNSNLTLAWNGWRGQFSLTGYYNRIADFIYLEPQDYAVLTVRGAFPAYLYNQSDAVLRGADLSASLPLPAGFSIETRASILRAQRAAPDSVGEGTHSAWLPLIPADRYQYGLQWTKKPKGAGAESYVRMMATTVLRQERVPPFGLPAPPPPAYTLLSLDAAHTFPIGKNALEVGLNIQNLGNARYRDYLNFFRFFADEPGVNAGLRLKYTFG